MITHQYTSQFRTVTEKLMRETKIITHICVHAMIIQANGSCRLMGSSVIQDLIILILKLA